MENDARLTIRLPAELVIKVGREAEESDRTTSWMVRKALEQRYQEPDTEKGERS